MLKCINLTFVQLAILEEFIIFMFLNVSITIIHKMPMLLVTVLASMFTLEQLMNVQLTFNSKLQVLNRLKAVVIQY